MKEYLLDTNAYYNLLAYSNAVNCGSDGNILEIINTLKSGKVLISTITQIEIISVLGKYARGGGGCSKCERTISPDGDKCTNTVYTPKRKKWSRKKIAGFRKLINETMDGTSKLISVSTLPFDQNTILEARKIIEYALKYSFASMDAMIAATAKNAIKNGCNLTVITSDRSLKKCLEECEIPVWDAFSIQKVS